MFISEAFAQGAVAAVDGPSPIWNLGMLAVMVGLFYLLLIRPQQKRFKEHSAVLSSLGKGDAVVTGGGLVGVVDSVVGDDQLVVDLGNGVKVTAMRPTITGKAADSVKVPATKKDAPKTKAAAKTAPTKKAAPKKTATKKAAPKKAATKKAPAKKPAAKKKTAANKK